MVRADESPRVGLRFIYGGHEFVITKITTLPMGSAAAKDAPNGLQIDCLSIAEVTKRQHRLSELLKGEAATPTRSKDATPGTSGGTATGHG